jgi:hypothetical protein
MSRRKKKGKFARSEMLDINKTYSFKNVIMKVISHMNVNFCKQFATPIEDKVMKPMIFH